MSSLRKNSATTLEDTEKRQRHAVTNNNIIASIENCPMLAKTRMNCQWGRQTQYGVVVERYSLIGRSEQY